MTRPPVEPLFLERRTYRARRLRDAARVLPILGAVLFLLPILWTNDGASTARGFLYLFIVWTVLIVISGLLAHRIARTERGVATRRDG